MKHTVLLLFTVLLVGCAKPKWEYRIEALPDEKFIENMNGLGDMGWEMVSARRASDGSTSDPKFSYEVIFKRQK